MENIIIGALNTLFASVGAAFILWCWMPAAGVNSKTVNSEQLAAPLLNGESGVGVVPRDGEQLSPAPLTLEAEPEIQGPQLPKLTEPELPQTTAGFSAEIELVDWATETTLTSPSTGALTFEAPTYLYFFVDGQNVELNLKTGEVKLPKKMKLSKAAVGFWKALSTAYPEARRAIVAEGVAELLTTKGRGK